MVLQSKSTHSICLPTNTPLEDIDEEDCLNLLKLFGRCLARTEGFGEGLPPGGEIAFGHEYHSIDVEEMLYSKSCNVTEEDLNAAAQQVDEELGKGQACCKLFIDKPEWGISLCH